MGIAVGVAAAAVAMGTPSYAANAADVVKGAKVSGYVDTTYTYNLNDPASRVNALRVFDTEANSFLLNNSELSFTKDAPAGGAGFGLVLNYGTDAQITQAAGSVISPDTLKNDFDIQEAYVSSAFKSGKGWLRFGKFVTLHGAEVIKSTGDYNISRSFLFGYAIPFTHTGLRVHYEAGPNLSGHFGVNNGWDNLKDDGKGKTAELQVGLSLPDMLALSVTGMYGPEDNDGTGAGTAQDSRGLVDVVATLTPANNMTVVLNYDRASQAKANGGAAPALWQGYAAYLNMGLGEKHSATVRGEVFDDHDGYRTGTVQTLKEVTLTLSCKQVENLEMRAEYRYDMSNQNVFQDDKAVAKDTQSTVGVQFIYSF
jgi:hypothetical protein